MKKKSKNLLVLVILLAIIGIAVGYAALAQTLTLNGTAKTLTQKDWYVHFEKGSETVKENDGAMDATFTITDDTTGTFEATLVPGSSVVYTVNIKNDGSLDAELTGITYPKAVLDGLVSCEVTPAATAGEILQAQGQKAYTITLTYVGDELPADGTTVEAAVDVVFDYVQADTTASV